MQPIKYNVRFLEDGSPWEENKILLQLTSLQIKNLTWFFCGSYISDEQKFENIFQF